MNANYCQIVELAEEELLEIYLNQSHESVARMLIASNKALNTLAIPTSYNPSIQGVSDKIAKFSDVTFGEDRPFTAPLHHMKLEVDEAIESGNEEEFADILLLLLDSYRKKHPLKSTKDLLNCANAKIEKLKTRKWQKADERGVVQHIRE